TSPDGQNIPAAAGAQPGQDIPAAPEHRPEAPAAASHSGPATYRAPGAYPAPGAQPAYAPQSAPGHPASSPGLQPPHAGWPAPGPRLSSRGDVTGIPADGPITWPKRSTGIIGVANLVASAVLAVIWAWIPLGLLFTGIGGIFALGLGVLALVVWVLVQQGANI